MFLSLKDLNTLRNHQTTQKSKFEFICLQRVCKGRHQSHGWERWIKAGTRWRTVETDMITGKGTFSDIITNFSSSFRNNRRISIRSLFFSSCTWKKYYVHLQSVWLSFNALHTQSLHYVNIRKFFTCFNCIWQIKFHFATLDFAPSHAISLKTTCIYHVFEPRHPTPLKNFTWNFMLLIVNFPRILPHFYFFYA